MPTTPEQYNQRQLDEKLITGADIAYMMKVVQPDLGVLPDSKCGPATLEFLRKKYGPQPSPVENLHINAMNIFDKANYIPTHISWYGGRQFPNGPLGIVWHTSDTNAGTAVTMAKRRTRQFGLDEDDRPGTWHLSIEMDGSLVQQVPFHINAAHAHSSTAKRLPFGWANYTTIGIELISPDDKNFPEVQIEAAKKVARALVKTYKIPADRANIFHKDIDPQRRSDPGQEWITQHAPKVMEYAYA